MLSWPQPVASLVRSQDCRSPAVADQYQPAPAYPLAGQGIRLPILEAARAVSAAAEQTTPKMPHPDDLSSAPRRLTPLCQRPNLFRLGPPIHSICVLRRACTGPHRPAPIQAEPAAALPCRWPPQLLAADTTPRPS